MPRQSQLDQFCSDTPFFVIARRSVPRQSPCGSVAVQQSLLILQETAAVVPKKHRDSLAVTGVDEYVSLRGVLCCGNLLAVP